MNLATDAWIPIVWADGRAGTASLRDAFDRGEEIRDLAVRAHERIALMRLLTCIAQAALNGPADHDDWEACRPRIAPSALDYLNRWRHAFELFGSSQRFAQVANLRRPPGKSGSQDDEDNSASKLDLALATGNNTTLFDNAGGSERTFADAQLALMLLAFQCFSPCGTIGVALWNGTPVQGWSSYPDASPGQSSHAPCVSGNILHAYRRGGNLLDSLHANLITKEQAEMFCGRGGWGKPVWEAMPSSPKDMHATRNATTTYLGRLVPLSRTVRLADDRRSLTLANGLDYPSYPEWREAAATIVTWLRKKEPTRLALPADLSKGTWRELHALMVSATDKGSNGGPVALRNLTNDADFDLWVGGLVAAGNGKLLDTTESTFRVPAAMLSETGQRVYQEGVEYSERAERRLRKAISTYRMAMEGSESDLGKIHRRLAALKNPERERLRGPAGRAATQFWTDVELAVPRLLATAGAPEGLGLKAEWHKTPWGKSVWRAARAAYERACPHETPRQIRAYALGLNSLFTPPAAEPQAGNGEEAEA